MAKVRDIVTDAFYKIGVAADDEPLDAARTKRGVDAFNNMLHAWKLRGVDLTHTDLTANDDFPIGDEFKEGTIYTLAKRLDHSYQAPTAFNSETWFRLIQAAYRQANAATMDKGLLDLPSQRFRRIL